MTNARRRQPPQVRTGVPQGPARARGVTHEPDAPVDWPDGHVGVELTGEDEGECIVVRIHTVTHYLHTTTAIELRRMLTEQIEAWEAGATDVMGGTGVHDVLRHMRSQ